MFCKFFLNIRLFYYIFCCQAFPLFFIIRFTKIYHFSIYIYIYIYMIVTFCQKMASSPIKISVLHNHWHTNDSISFLRQISTPDISTIFCGLQYMSPSDALLNWSIRKLNDLSTLLHIGQMLGNLILFMYWCCGWLTKQDFDWNTQLQRLYISSSSSSNHADSADFPDSPSILIIHCSWQVFQITSCAYTEPM